MNFKIVSKKTVNILFLIVFITQFISCGESNPEFVLPTPTFKDPGLVLEGSAGEVVKVDILNEGYALDFTLMVNGVVVYPTTYGGVSGEYNTYGFEVPAKCGSGLIELKDVNGKIVQGPQFKYIPKYIFTKVNSLSKGLCRFQGNSLLSWSPFTKDFRKIGFKRFVSLSESIGEIEFTSSQYKPTLPGGFLTYAYYHNGIAVSNEQEVFFYQQYKPASVTEHKIMVTNFDWVIENVSTHTSWVHDIELDADGNIYTAQVDVPYINKTSLTGTSIFVGSATSGHVDGTGANAKFTAVRGIAIDQNGNLFVADEHTVRMVTKQGVVNTIAGATESGDVIGPVSQARFNKIMGIYVKDDGTIYVVDAGNKKVKTISPDHTKVENTKIGFTPNTDDKYGVPLFVDESGIVYINSAKDGNIYAYIPEEIIPATYFNPSPSIYYQSNLVNE